MQWYHTVLASGKPRHLHAKALLMMPYSRNLVTVTVTVAAICILFLWTVVAVSKIPFIQCLVKSHIQTAFACCISSKGLVVLDIHNDHIWQSA